MMHRAFSSIRRAVPRRHMSAEPVFSFEKPQFFGRPGSDAMKYVMRVVTTTLTQHAPLMPISYTHALHEPVTIISPPRT